MLCRPVLAFTALVLPTPPLCLWPPPSRVRTGCGRSASDADGGKRVPFHVRDAQASRSSSSRWSVKSSSHKPVPSQMEPPSAAVLQERWTQARSSTHNPRHVKINRFCPKCLLRTLGGKNLSRMSERPQRRHEDLARTVASAELSTASSRQVRRGWSEAPRGKGRHRNVHLSDDPGVLLHGQASPNAQPPLSPYRKAQAGKTHSRASEIWHLEGTARTAPRGHQSRNKSQETSWANPRPGPCEAENRLPSRVKSLIAEEDTAEPAKPPSVLAVMASVYQIPQQAGLQSGHLSAIASVLGAPLPPPPPGADSAAVPKVDQVASTPAQLNLPQAPAPVTSTGTAIPEHARNRKSRPLTARRPLPARGGQADYASTHRDDSSSRGASRTPDRGGPGALPATLPGHPPGNSPGTVSPTLPMGALQPLASSLEGAAPPP